MSAGVADNGEVTVDDVRFGRAAFRPRIGGAPIGRIVSRRRFAVAALVLVVALAALAFAGGARAAESVLAFENAEDEARYAELLGEYRCLKCQNQSLADSNASLARDLRQAIYERVVAGEPKAAIDDYLVARYGDFVLYRPRLTATTALLWIGPFVLLVIALGGAVLIARRSGRDTVAPPREALAEARRLLDEPPPER